MPPATVAGSTALGFSRFYRHVDVRGQNLGRTATRIATVLMGKHKPEFSKAQDCGDYVVVSNARHIAVTGKKAEQKVYPYYTGYAGGLKEDTFARLMERKPDEILRKAVGRMLPKNRLHDRRLERLIIFPDEADAVQKQNVIKDYTTGVSQ